MISASASSGEGRTPRLPFEPYFNVQLSGASGTGARELRARGRGADAPDDVVTRLAVKLLGPEADPTSLLLLGEGGRGRDARRCPPARAVKNYPVFQYVKSILVNVARWRYRVPRQRGKVKSAIWLILVTRSTVQLK